MDDSRFDPRTHGSFGHQLALYLLSHRPDLARATGSIDWTKLADELPTISYEVLRKAISGERPPSDRLIEAVAAHLELAPRFFAEYRLSQDRRGLDPQTYGGGAEGVERALRYLPTARLPWTSDE